MMYKCNECDEKFDVPKCTVTTYESYYGISDGHKLLFLKLCPYCGSEDIQELRMEDDNEYSSIDWQDDE